jgi:hypothetical protein
LNGSGEVWDRGPWQRTILNTLRPNWKTVSQKFNAQWGKIVPQRHVLFKMFRIYNYKPLFHYMCLKVLYGHKRLCEV